jgi:hypothetical protein
VTGATLLPRKISGFEVPIDDKGLFMFARGSSSFGIERVMITVDPDLFCAGESYGHRITLKILPADVWVEIFPSNDWIIWFFFNDP